MKIAPYEHPHVMHERSQCDLPPHGNHEMLGIRGTNAIALIPVATVRLQQWSLAECRQLRHWPTNIVGICLQLTVHMAQITVIGLHARRLLHSLHRQRRSLRSIQHALRSSTKSNTEDRNCHPGLSVTTAGTVTLA
jgi:hypothetical protein